MPTARDLDELDLDLHGLARLGFLGELQLPGRVFPTAARGVAGHQPGESRVAGFLRCPDGRYRLRRVFSPLAKTPMNARNEFRALMSRTIRS
jgi:hypothetical protein